ncbi:SprT family zinc-dependent metalloprotease [Terasakiella sp. SH-1]|uniref:M48 family metallopeptidase n=1 Tax=Terasakiella sp. SH-1 TaxID=2560057 RepID=UPI0010740403|nr:SprT family zinc-dependent metalloprotease [Terasakiella sp. SH-1]
MSHFIELDGQEIPVALRWNAQARRLILRLNPKNDGIIVTLPKGISAKEGLEMAKRNKVWIANQFSRQPEAPKFQHGAEVMLRGVAHKLIHRPEARGTVWCENQQIFVAGKAEFFQRRLSDWFKKQAREDIHSCAHDLASQLGKGINRISVRDTVSRWGSCSSNGNLSFNWRLIMAPPDIFRYVIAHEVAHLKHMDHSPAFWQTVDRLGVDAQNARLWLKRHGNLLQKAGRS